jgi:hypothetical protein
VTSTVIEMARITLGAGKTEADLVAASNAFQSAFLAEQPGFVRRELIRTEDGGYADLVTWRSMADAHAIMAKVSGSAACLAYFAVMDMSGDMTAGVAHYEVLASYG